jgi:hypothetical protein
LPSKLLIQDLAWVSHGTGEGGEPSALYFANSMNILIWNNGNLDVTAVRGLVDSNGTTCVQRDLW